MRSGKTIISLIAVVSLVVVSPLTAVAQISSWTNGGFENWLTNWTAAQNSATGTLSVNTTLAHTGTYSFSAAITSTGTTNLASLTHTTFTAQAGSTYRLSFWAQSSINRPPMYVTILSASGPTYSNVLFEASDEGWDEYDYCFTASGACTITFSFGAVATYYLDDIQVYDQNDPVFDTAISWMWQWGEQTFESTTPFGCWTGGDNDISVQLPDGRVVWLFNDSFRSNSSGINFYSNNRYSVLANGLSRNYVMIQSGSTLTPLSTNTFFVPTGTTDVYWPTDAAVDGGNLEVILADVENSGSGPGRNLAMATLSLPGLTPTSTTTLTGTFSRILNGDDGYFYIFGIAATGSGTGVARAPVGSLSNQSAWTYYDGANWDATASSAAPLPNLVPATPAPPYEWNLGSMERIGPNNYAAIDYQAPGYKPSVQFAPSPVGPWSNPVVIYSIPGQTQDSYYYFDYIHKETYQNGVYTLGYSDNGGSEGDDWLTKGFYNPHYIKTPNLLALSPYTTNAFSDTFANSYDTVGWQTFGGTWSISGGQYMQTNTMAAEYYSIEKGAVNADANLSANITINSSGTNGQAALVFRASNYNVGTDNYYGYNVVLKPGAGVLLTRSNAGTSTQIGSSSTSIVAGATYPVQVTAVGNLIQVFINNSDTPIISVNDDSYACGGAGLRTYNATASFGNFGVGGYSLNDEAALLTVAASSGDTNAMVNNSGATYGVVDLYEANGVGDYVESVPSAERL